MKLLLEKWRKYIKEAELKHSESAEEQIWDAVDVAYKNDRNALQEIEIPAEEIFYFDNKKISIFMNYSLNKYFFHMLIRWEI